MAVRRLWKMNTDKIYAERWQMNMHLDTHQQWWHFKLDKKGKASCEHFYLLAGNTFRHWFLHWMRLEWVIGSGSTASFVAGIIIGIYRHDRQAGVNLPIYKKLLEKESRKYAFWYNSVAKRDKWQVIYEKGTELCGDSHCGVYVSCAQQEDKNRGVKNLNKSESKYFNTAEKMDKAFLDLAKEKDFLLSR